jgi:chromosome partitioning protein|tara:strand:- start:24 stop:794 length:771 start_codon:yes stop_codon:yes gene_type:complete
MPEIIVVANQKGGVGKTTTSINLAAALQRINYKTLLVDLDSQGNATSASGLNRSTEKASVYDVLMGLKNIEDCFVTSQHDGFTLLPSNSDLMAAEIELLNTNNRESVLKEKINSISREFDYILIDSPPSMNILTLNALAAANEIIIPVQCEYYALEGMSGLLESIYKIKETINPNLQIKGVLRTMFDSRNSLSVEVSAQLKKYFGDKLFWTFIPRNVRLAEAPSHGMSAVSYDPECLGSKAYLSLAKEVTKKTMES